MVLPKFQNTYGVSNEGTFSWGDKLASPAPNYAKEFYQPGYTTNNSIALSGGNENISSYFSYANVSSNGIVPENDYMSHNLMAKVGFNLWKKVHVDVSARYNNQHIENQPAAGYLSNPIITRITMKFMMVHAISMYTTGPIHFRNSLRIHTGC